MTAEEQGWRKLPNPYQVYIFNMNSYKTTTKHNVFCSKAWPFMMVNGREYERVRTLGSIVLLVVWLRYSAILVPAWELENMIIKCWTIIKTLITLLHKPAHTHKLRHFLLLRTCYTPIQSIAVCRTLICIELSSAPLCMVYSITY